MSRKTTLERFEAKFEPCPITGCWLWNANTTRGYYGCFRFVGKVKGAHRVAYELYIGPIPDGLHVLHTCDVPLCVNPDHLFLGTHRDNMQDRNRKGRASTKLCPKQVLAIYQRARIGERQANIAKDYHIRREVVSKIKTGNLWAHVTGASS